jgi:hypothetical protein
MNNVIVFTCSYTEDISESGPADNLTTRILPLKLDVFCYRPHHLPSEPRLWVIASFT